MTEHPIQEMFESYVMGAIGDLERAELEAHVIECSDCAGELAIEARTELAMIAVAGMTERCPSCRRACREARCGHCGAAGQVGAFRTRAVLSQSAQGRVYLADGPEGDRVALKELVFTQVPNMDTVEAFEREGRVLRQLDHPRIPRYIDSFIDGDGVHMRFYLAQSYVQGVSLAERLESHRYSEAEVRDIARQVLSVLVYLQGLSPQVVHRDLKPSNLVQRPDDAIVLVDFGSARERGLTVHGTFAGTFGYAPPEQLTGIVDATSDVYALGVTLIHLLTRVASQGALMGAPEMAKAHVSTALRRWLERMTAPKPSDRFPSAESALVALQEARPGAFAARERMWARAVVALAMLMIVVVGGYVWRELGKLLPEPQGARVFVDGSPIQLENGDVARTPLVQLSNLEYGKTYLITFDKEGYELHTETLVMNGFVEDVDLKPTLTLRPIEPE